MEAESTSPLLVALELHRAYVTAMSRLNKALEPLDLGYRHVSAMFLIRDGVRTHRDLARALQLDKAGMFRTLTELGRSGLVIRTQSERDGRVKLYQLTSLGESLLVEAQQHTRAVAEQLFGRFSLAELASLQVALARVRGD